MNPRRILLELLAAGMLCWIILDRVAQHLRRLLSGNAIALSHLVSPEDINEQDPARPGGGAARRDRV